MFSKTFGTLVFQTFHPNASGNKPRDSCSVSSKENVKFPNTKNSLRIYGNLVTPMMIYWGHLNLDSYQVLLQEQTF